MDMEGIHLDSPLSRFDVLKSTFTKEELVSQFNRYKQEAIQLK
jgi:hypothetical protein